MSTRQPSTPGGEDTSALKRDFERSIYERTDMEDRAASPATGQPLDKAEVLKVAAQVRNAITGERGTTMTAGNAWWRLIADALEAYAVSETRETAKQRFDELMAGERELAPLERLRFFCSLAMNGQDWLDVEPFFDALAVSATRLTDEQIMNAACTAADALDATRVSEMVPGGWKATTIFEGDTGLLRLGRLIEKAINGK